ncbi:hypothetical protein AAU61_03595 [Desulfocarbo indianensis]|nr:hypothetical protein AAU61_03595 [Desulfocarbo indianensis]
MGAALALAFTGPAAASVISFGHWNSGGNWDAVVDGGAFNGGAFFSGDPQGGSTGGHGNQWGQYQGRGWFASGWQRLEGGTYDGSYLWVDNFNLYDAIFGDPNNYQPLQVGNYHLDGGYQLGVNLYTSMPQSWGRISQDEYDASYGGALTLTDILFGDDSDGVGKITLIGQITGDMAGALGSDALAFSWTLQDHDSSPNHTLLSGLNSDKNHPPQMHLRGEGSLSGAQATPEPASMLLLASALGAGGAFAGWRRRRAA